jgi:spermidine synthase
VLIGGLGMGYSLKTALAALGDDAEVVVAELVPAVVTWNREFLGHLADHPLRDPRVVVREQDVARVIREAKASYDAILLDVDNGPEGLIRKANDWIYARAGLLAARAALRPHGVLGVWSSTPEASFVQRLRQAEFEVEEHAVRARGKGQGARHTIWLAVPR